MTDGLGLYEMLILCELLDAPCQLSAYTGYSMLAPYASMSESERFARDALDLLDFANGETSTLAAARARMGHPASFNLRRLEVGNEERILTIEGYAAHYDLITSRLWQRYPKLQIVAAGRWRGPLSANEDPGSPCLLGMRCDMIDQHFYQTADEMVTMGSQYDLYNRSWPRIYVGEFAANKPMDRTEDGSLTAHATLQSALAESVFTLGLIRNADVVAASSLAPVLSNVYGTQWAHTLISFNASHLFCSPSYHALHLLARSRGAYSLPISPPSDDSTWGAAAALSDDERVVYVYMVNYAHSARAVNISIAFESAVVHGADVLTADHAEAVNSLESPEAVVVAAMRPMPFVSQLAVGDGLLSVELPAWSLAVVQVGVGGE